MVLSYTALNLGIPDKISSNLLVTGYDCPFLTGFLEQKLQHAT